MHTLMLKGRNDLGGSCKKVLFSQKEPIFMILGGNAGWGEQEERPLLDNNGAILSQNE